MKFVIHRRIETFFFWPGIDDFRHALVSEKGNVFDRQKFSLGQCPSLLSFLSSPEILFGKTN
jgi:hypothetical protein